MALSKKFITVFASVLSASVFFACSESNNSPTGAEGAVESSSDGVQSSSSNTLGVNVYATLEDLPNCTTSRENQLVVVATSNTPYTCTEGRWVVYGISSSSSSTSSSSVDPGFDSPVMSDGYYSNSSNCPAGLTCKYATTTDYLNSSKTYGEILDTRDGQVYKTIVNCDEDNKNCQTWMAQNLNYAYTGVKYNYDGYTSDSTSWCYDGDPSNCGTYGRLYTWAAAVDSVAIYQKYGEECGYGKSCPRFSASALATTPVRGVCPSGWHLPSNAEWSTLYTNVGGTSCAVQRLKAGSSLWSSTRGTDEYGVSVLPAGSCNRSGGGNFDGQGNSASFWSSTEIDHTYAWYQYFYWRDGYVNQDGSQHLGFSVRCLKDSF